MIRHANLSKNESGFTLVELLLASALFSFILLFVTTGIVQINRAYNKGLTVKRMHQNARDITEILSRSITEAQSIDAVALTNYGGSRYGLCVGNRHQFEWVEDYVDIVDSDHYSMARKLNNPCSGEIGMPITSGGDIEVLTEDFVAVDNIDIIKDPALNTVTIVVELATNRNDTSFGNPQPCVNANDPYCDFVRLETLVSIRS